MSLNKMFESVKSRTSGLIKSGFTARALNIFSGFLLDYTQEFHTKGMLTTQFKQ